MSDEYSFSHVLINFHHSAYYQNPFHTAKCIDLITEIEISVINTFLYNRIQYLFEFYIIGLKMIKLGPNV